MSETPAVATLKARRRRRQAGTPAEPPPVSPEEVAQGRGLTRRHPLLFDPAELPVVVESGGHVPPAVLSDRYTVAEFDVHEQSLPEGCRTPIMRTLWTRGQHVRRDVYAAYQRARERPASDPE